MPVLYDTAGPDRLLPSGEQCTDALPPFSWEVIHEESRTLTQDRSVQPSPANQMDGRGSDLLNGDLVDRIQIFDKTKQTRQSRLLSSPRIWTGAT